jgi:armadillo repeat-containing protein 8
VKCINTPEQFEAAAGSQDDIRVEAAQVITSLSYGAQSLLRTPFRVVIPDVPLSFFSLSGSPEALRSLLLSNAHQAFLYAISRFSPSEPPATKAAFSRALRALAVACAELVGPSQWGLRDDSSPVRDDAKLALEYFFQVMRCAHHLRPTRP